MCRGVVLWSCVVALLLVTPAAEATVPVAVFDGRGWGHGVGMPQWGAEYQARQGATSEQILGTFYPGTEQAERGGAVRVGVHTAPNASARLTFPRGGEVRSSLGADQADGFPVEVAPGGTVSISFDGAYRVDHVVAGQTSSRATVATSGDCLLVLDCEPSSTTTTTGGGSGGGLCGVLSECTTTTTARPTTTTTRPGATTTSRPTSTSSTTTPAAPARSSRPVWALPVEGGTTTVADRGRTYRGVIEATATAGPLRLVNHLDVETYLRGMGEVPGSWPSAAVEAQSVVARTYALRAMAASGEICDFDLCQVYLGVGGESAGQDAAVDATRGQVLTYEGALASTVYSASAGGVTATTLEGFGTPDGVHPYLRSTRYETDDPRPWRTEVALSDLADAFGYPGTVERITISEAGPSGRALTVVLVGDAGEQAVGGRHFSSRLGLRSTLWEVTLGSSDTPPPVPESGESVEQALPEDTDTIKAAATRGEAASLAERRRERPDPSRLLAAVASIDLLDDTGGTTTADLASLAVLGLAVTTAVAMAHWGLRPVEPSLLGERCWPRLAPLPDWVVSVRSRLRMLVRTRRTGSR